MRQLAAGRCVTGVAQPADAAEPSRARVHLALLVVQLSFATLSVEGKIAMSPTHGVSPLALAFARVAGAALVLVPLAARSEGPRVRRPRDVAAMALLSLLGIVLNQALFLTGLERTSPLAATLLVATIPVFTLGVAAGLGRERVVARTAAGIAAACLGVAALTGFRVPALGDTFVLLNAASYATYLVLARPYLERFGATTVVAWAFGLGALALAPFGAASLAREAAVWSASTALLVGWIVLVPTLLAYALNAWALRHATASLVTVYIYLQPVAVALLAWVELGERPEARAFGGGALILLGVTLVATRAPSESNPLAK